MIDITYRNIKIYPQYNIKHNTHSFHMTCLNKYITALKHNQSIYNLSHTGETIKTAGTVE